MNERVVHCLMNENAGVSSVVGQTLNVRLEFGGFPLIPQDRIHSHFL